MTGPRTTFLAVLVASILLAAPSSDAATSGAPRVTIVADSVGGVLFWQREARDELGRGLDLRIEIRTCRRLASEGCEYDGARPASALEAIRALGPAIGAVAVVDVGYNDAPSTYDAGLDKVMRALLDAGVQRVVWVTLRERRPSWAEINDEIRDGARRWPQITVGDWNRESAAHDEWFADGIHMNFEGGAAFGTFLRSLIADACDAACPSDEAVLNVSTARLRTARVGRRYVAQLDATGGTPPYRWSLSGLPRPLRVRPSGVVSGWPKTPGTYSMSAVVVDAEGVKNRSVVVLRVASRA
jgi:putative Ig domain-containing protein